MTTLRCLFLTALAACAPTPDVLPGGQMAVPGTLDLEVSSVAVVGEYMTLSATNGDENRMVHFVRESAHHRSACPSGFRFCFDLVGAQYMGSASMQDGQAKIEVLVPFDATVGSEWIFQAVQMKVIGPETSNLAGTIVGNPGDLPPPAQNDPGDIDPDPAGDAEPGVVPATGANDPFAPRE